jgi:hypothetical protein
VTSRRLLGVAAGLVLSFAGDGVSAACGAPPSGAASFLALGDTGQPPPLVPWLSGQSRVGRALEAEHRAQPVSALVFLGDLFYPDGIAEGELRERLRGNLVAPYCIFLRLTRLGRETLGDWCDEHRRERRPVPIVAVLGNHDVKEPESKELQRRLIPAYVANWRIPRVAEAYELPGGTSVVAFESQPVVDGARLRQLREALQRSRGPWRIVVAHHPIVDPGKGHEPDYAARVAAAIAEAGVPVHLFLAGHEHNLQALAGPGAALHVVSGAGSETRPVQPTAARRLFGAEQLGFARVDAIGAGGSARLRVTLFGLGESWWTPSHVRGEARPLACWEIGPDGELSTPTERVARGSSGRGARPFDSARLTRGQASRGLAARREARLALSAPAAARRAGGPAAARR